MTNNILKHDFVGVRKGQIYPETFKAGTECPQELVNAALSINAIESDKKAPKQNKAIKAAPENKG